VCASQCPLFGASRREREGVGERPKWGGKPLRGAEKIHLIVIWSMRFDLPARKKQRKSERKILCGRKTALPATQTLTYTVPRLG